MNELFQQRLSKATVLSLDVFDTALGRRCAYPDDAFLLMEEALLESHGQEFNGFGKARAEADSQARRLAWDERQAEEVSLEDIYRVLKRSHPGWTASVEELISLELETEKRLLYPISRTKKLIAMARLQGKRVVFISDMYLPKSFCETCLAENGFSDYDAFYLSSECGVLKHSGKLFQFALEDLQIEPGEMLHVGDNPHSDIEQADKLGIQTYLLPKAIDQLDRFPRNPFQHIAGSPSRSGRESLLLGLSARGCQEEQSSKDPLWHRFGYQIGGPLVYGYIRFLLNNLRGRGIEKAYFLSRDGFILKQVYHELAGEDAQYPQADYLFASRRALNFASVTELDPTTENWLAEGIHLTVGQFLQRINLSPEQFREAILANGFSGPEHPVVEGRDYANLRKLYHAITPSLMEAAAAERAIYLDYLREKGVLEAKPFVMVDVGWMTSIQQSFARMLHPVVPGLSIEGYYLGTYPEAIHRSGPTSRHLHYLMEYGQPPEAMHIIRHCVCLLEFFFAAPEHTFLHMKRNPEKGFVPELADFHENAADLQKLQHLHEGILDYAREMHRAGGHAPVDIQPQEVLSLLRRYLADPTAEEAEALGEIHYADGYGSYFHHTRMARPSGIAKLGLSKRKWKREFKACHWPMGYYKRLGTVEKLLFKLFHPSAKFSKPYG